MPLQASETLEYAALSVKSVNFSKLAAEAAAAGLPGAFSDTQYICTADLTEDQEQQLRAIIKAHDPTPTDDMKRIEKLRQRGWDARSAACFLVASNPKKAPQWAVDIATAELDFLMKL